MAKFCGNCGAPVKKGNKFCGNCGNALSSVSSKKKTKVTSSKKVKSSKAPSQIKSSKPGGKFMKVFFIISIVVATFYYLFNYTDMFYEQYDYPVYERYEEHQSEEIMPEEDYADKGESQVQTNSATSSKRSEQLQSNPTESKQMKMACQKVENAFGNVDIDQLKSLMTEQSQINYKSLNDEIKPYMKEYAKAFKDRKLLLKTNIYALYEFKDDAGNKYTAEFAIDEKGEWKLVRF